MVKNIYLLLLALVVCVGVSSCNKDDKEPNYGTELKPQDTGLCYKTWIAVSAGGDYISPGQYETLGFNVDGTGISTTINESEGKFVTKTFTWTSYKNGSSYVMKTNIGGDEAVKYYDMKDDGIIRFHSTDMAYNYQVKKLEDSYMSGKLAGKKWVLLSIDGTNVTGYTYESFELKADGTGVHTKYDTAQAPKDGVSITWAGYVVREDFGIISVTESGKVKFYTCIFKTDGSVNLINFYPRFVMNLKPEN